MDRGFFDDVRDAFETMGHRSALPLHTYAHRRGVKVWFGEATKEHYEAQVIRHEGGTALEIGFHAEHSTAEKNDRVLARFDTDRWREALGDDPESGQFLGVERWRRVSELWAPFDLDDPDDTDTDMAIDVAARLAEYVTTFEPMRATGGS